MAERVDIAARLREREDAARRAVTLAPDIARAADALVRSLAAGGTVYACGNGGSATQAAHLVGELVGRFKKERGAFRALSLAENAATLTAVANDYDFADVFARQLAGVARSEDCVVAFSTSGESENVWRACRTAHSAGTAVIALTGQAGGRVADAADIAIRVPDADTPRIQEIHLVVIHLLCEIVEERLADAHPLRR